MPLLSPKLLLVFWISLGALIWSLFPVVSKFGVEQTLNAYDITALRYLVAAVVLAPYLLKYGFGLSIKRCILLTLFAGFPGNLAYILSLEYIPASHANAVVESITIFLASVLAFFILHQQQTKTQMAGIALLIIGILLLGNQLFDTPTWSGLQGYAILFIDPLLWCCYIIVGQKWGLKGMQTPAIIAVFSTLIYLPPYLLLSDAPFYAAPMNEVLLQGAFQGIVICVVGMICYAKVLELGGTKSAVILMASMPVGSALLAVFLLGENLTSLEILGIAVITAGIYFAKDKGKKEI